MEREKGSVEVSKETRTIYLYGDFNKGSCLETVKSLKEMEIQNPSKDIDIYINSPGGYISDMLAMYEVIRTLECKVNTHGTGEVCSAGAFLLAVGTGTRYAYKYSRYMIHELWSVNWGKLTDMDIYHEELKRLQNIINEIFAKVTGQPKEKIEKDMNRDKWMNSNESLEYGLVDKIK
jgi:ATP-dependent Clp protease protease subunit